MNPCPDDSWSRASTDWLHAAGWGVFTHFLSGVPEPETMDTDKWNRRVEAVDVERLAAQIADTGAGYHFMTVGQNSGYYCAPNATYDEIVGGPSRLTRRDLVGELADALATRGVRAMVYAPSHGPAEDRRAIEALGFTPEWDASAWQLKPGTYLRRHQVDERLSRAQRNWEAVLGEWSVRWGRRIHGWWIDGCFHAERMYRHDQPPNFRSLASTVKRGNPEAIIAFNGGHDLFEPLSVYDDYTAGEAFTPPTVHRWRDLSRFVDGAQLHVLTYLGANWGDPRLRFNDELVRGYTRHLRDHGGVMSWDVAIDAQGRIPDHCRRQLGLLGGA